MNKKTFSLISLLRISVIAFFLGLGLIACGNTTPTDAGSTPSPNSAQACGAISQSQNPVAQQVNPDQAQKSLDCFWNAFQKCQIASLTYSLTGVDTITKHTFSTKLDASGCKVSDAVQQTIVPKPLSNPSTYICAGLTHEPGVLHFKGCGQVGDVDVALKK
ncbi:MAG: hypothetical protein E6J34_10425 [Chloroflexi bacterium]|nr:MAG: hypothetical protein E6J34_10425 [Chloroflexota bacterium]